MPIGVYDRKKAKNLRVLEKARAVRSANAARKREEKAKQLAIAPYARPEAKAAILIIYPCDEPPQLATSKAQAHDYIDDYIRNSGISSGDADLVRVYDLGAAPKLALKFETETVIKAVIL